MPLHYTRNGYTLSADAHSLTITPGPKPIRLERSQLERLGLAIRQARKDLLWLAPRRLPYHCLHGSQPVVSAWGTQVEVPGGRVVPRLSDP